MSRTFKTSLDINVSPPNYPRDISQLETQTTEWLNIKPTRNLDGAKTWGSKCDIYGLGWSSVSPHSYKSLDLDIGVGGLMLKISKT